MKKSILAAAGLLLAVSGGWAAVVEDGFDRDNTTQNNCTANIAGTGWVQAGDGTTGSDWFIDNNTLVVRPRDGSARLYNTALETQSGNGINFTLRVDARGLASNVWIGIIFNYINENSYYLLRFKTGFADYQLIQKDGTEIALLKAGTVSEVFEVGVDYTLTVMSDAAGVFYFKIDGAGGRNVADWTWVDDSSSALNSGYAGLYAAFLPKHVARFDNFSLEINHL